MDGAENEVSAKPRRKGIQSILTGFKVLDFLVRADMPVPLRDIARGTGLSASKLQFYLISLTEVGMVKQDQNTGHYGLGPYTLKLGILGLQQFDIYKSAYPRLQKLADETGQLVSLGVWGNKGPTVIARAECAANRAVFDLRPGSVLPVLTSALGRLFLAYLPDDLTKPYLPDRHSWTRDRARDIRTQGLCIFRGGLLADHTALSAPIFDQDGHIIAGVTVTGPQDALDDSPLGPVAMALKDMTGEISDEAGATTRHYLQL
jgi:DNA-binding IclR family transcriptional regulator